MKKTFLILLTITLIAVLAIGMTISTYAEDTVHSGTLGNLSWSLNETTGNLSISGTGSMYGFSSSSTSAWRNYEASIKTVTIEEGVTSIGDSAFYNCTNLTSVTIPDSVTSIGVEAFSRCDSLTSITIGNGVTSIGIQAFRDCANLASVTIPDSVTSIGNEAFYGCSRLTSINVDENNTAYKSIDGNLYTKDGKTLIQYAIGKTDTHFTIPDSVTSIGNEAFVDCRKLTSIRIGISVVSIEKFAFGGCTSLTSVTIPDSVTNIGFLAFADCTSLVKIVYCGTEEQWNAITKLPHWDTNTGEWSIQKHDYHLEKSTIESHKSVCSNCGDTIYLDHTWNNGEITTPATQIIEGVKTFTCTDCGETKTEVIKKITTENTKVPEVTTGPVETTGTTKAPETSGTTDSTTSGGCSSNLGAGFSVIAIVMGVAVLAIYKKKRI